MFHMQEMQHVKQMEQDDTHVREPNDNIYRHESHLQVIKTSKKLATHVVTSLLNMLHVANVVHILI